MRLVIAFSPGFSVPFSVSCEEEAFMQSLKEKADRISAVLCERRKFAAGVMTQSLSVSDPDASTVNVSEENTVPAKETEVAKPVREVPRRRSAELPITRRCESRIARLGTNWHRSTSRPRFPSAISAEPRSPAKRHRIPRPTYSSEKKTVTIVRSIEPSAKTRLYITRLPDTGKPSRTAGIGDETDAKQIRKALIGAHGAMSIVFLTLNTRSSNAFYCFLNT